MQNPYSIYVNTLADFDYIRNKRKLNCTIYLNIVAGLTYFISLTVGLSLLHLFKHFNFILFYITALLLLSLNIIIYFINDKALKDK